MSRRPSTALSALTPAQCQKLVWLRDSYGLDFAAIGERYGLSQPGAVELYYRIKRGAGHALKHGVNGKERANG